MFGIPPRLRMSLDCPPITLAGFVNFTMPGIFAGTCLIAETGSCLVLSLPINVVPSFVVNPEIAEAPLEIVATVPPAI